MSMSTYVKGIRPADELWSQMKAVWDSCVAAKIEIPQEVMEFFDWEAPDPKGIVVDIDSAVVEWRGEMQEGLEIDLAKLPSNITHVRFFNSW